MNNYRRNSKPHSRLLPYATIRAASEGDPDAVNAVRQLHDEYGNTYLCVDEAMRRRLEIKLITGILAFRAA